MPDGIATTFESLLYLRGGRPTKKNQMRDAPWNNLLFTPLSRR